MLFKRNKSKNINKRSVDIQSPTSVSTSVSAVSAVYGQLPMSVLGYNLSSVFRAVSLISSSIASLPCILYKFDDDGNKSRYTQHPLYKILSSRPNLKMSAYQLAKSMISDMLLNGNAYALIIRDPQTLQVNSLEYVPANSVQVIEVTNSQGLTTEIDYNVAQFPRLFQQNEIIHIINEPDRGGYRGISTLTCASRTLNIASYSDQAAENYLANGGSLKGFVKMNGRLTPQQKSDLKNAWIETMQTNNSGVMFLDSMQDYTPLQLNPAEAQLLESRKFEIDEIARFFNVNPILLYDLDKNSYNSSEQAHLSLLTDTLAPILSKIENELNNKLLILKNEQNCVISCDTDAFLRADLKTKADYYKSLLQSGALSINEVRAKLDLNSIADGDTHYIQSNMISLQNASKIGDTIKANPTPPDPSAE